MKSCLVILAFLVSCTYTTDTQDPPDDPGPDHLLGSVAQAPTTAPSGQIRILAGSGVLSSFDFGSTEVGKDSVTLGLTIENDTDAVTGELSVVLSGMDPGQYRLEPGTDCDDHLVLAPGASCAVRLCFSPTALGPATSELDVSATPGGTATVALSGTGVSAPSLSVSPPFRDFGVIEFGQVLTQTFTITNTGPDVSISSVAVPVGLGAGFSIQSTTCGGQLAAGTSCDATIAFAPSAFGQDSGDLAVTTNLGVITQGANFVLGYGAGRVDVTLAGAGTGSVTSDGGGVPNIDCPSSSCTGLFVGPSHVLTANPADGSVFAGWSDASCGTSSTCDVTAGTTPVAITARFEP